MQTYLIYTPNGDIYHRQADTILDDLHDHMEQGDLQVKAWHNDSHLDDHRPPMWTLNSNADIFEWLETDSPAPRRHYNVTVWLNEFKSQYTLT